MFEPSVTEERCQQIDFSFRIQVGNRWEEHCLPGSDHTSAITSADVMGENTRSSEPESYNQSVIAVVSKEVILLFHQNRGFHFAVTFDLACNDHRACALNTVIMRMREDIPCIATSNLAFNDLCACPVWYNKTHTRSSLNISDYNFV